MPVTMDTTDAVQLASETPARLTMTWEMTSEGLRMRWRARSDAASQSVVALEPREQHTAQAA
jgi:hypothetical protein